MESGFVAGAGLAPGAKSEFIHILADMQWPGKFEWAARMGGSCGSWIWPATPWLLGADTCPGRDLGTGRLDDLRNSSTPTRPIQRQDMFPVGREFLDPLLMIGACPPVSWDVYSCLSITSISHDLDIFLDPLLIASRQMACLASWQRSRNGVADCNPTPLLPVCRPRLPMPAPGSSRNCGYPAGTTGKVIRPSCGSLLRAAREAASRATDHGWENGGGAAWQAR